MATLKPRDVITYLYIEKKGVWEDIYTALKDKEPLPDDTSKVARMVEDFESKNPKYITITDKHYPVAFTRAFHPPFLVMFSGMDNLDIVDKDQMVCVEDDMLDAVLSKHRFRHSYISESGWLHVKTPKPEGGMNAVVIQTDRQTSLNIMQSIGKKFVATKGDYEFASMAAEKLGDENFKAFALPGNSGCRCNQLIKDGWKLCDTWEDLVWDKDPVDPEPMPE